MCWRTEEEVEPTVGLPRHRHFVRFFNARKTLRINRTTWLHHMIGHSGTSRIEGKACLPPALTSPTTPLSPPSISERRVLRARKSLLFPSSLFSQVFPFSFRPSPLLPHPYPFSVFSRLAPHPPPLPPLIPFLTLSAHSELTLTKWM